MKTYIYLVENIRSDEEIYIGKTTNIDRRHQAHKQKWGNNIFFTIIDEIDSTQRGNWEPLESYWIEQFICWGFNLLNKNKGGGGPDWFSKESKQKISLTKQGNPRSEETKRKISNSLKGYKRSQSNINKLKSRILPPNISRSKPIIQYDIYHNFISEYRSLRQAADILDLDYGQLSKHLRKSKDCTKTVKGYIFEYKNNIM
jgi:hypothetical protein